MNLKLDQMNLIINIIPEREDCEWESSDFIGFTARGYTLENGFSRRQRRGYKARLNIMEERGHPCLVPLDIAIGDESWILTINLVWAF